MLLSPNMSARKGAYGQILICRGYALLVLFFKKSLSILQPG